MTTTGVWALELNGPALLANTVTQHVTLRTAMVMGWTSFHLKVLLKLDYPENIVF